MSWANMDVVSTRVAVGPFCPAVLPDAPGSRRRLAGFLEAPQDGDARGKRSRPARGQQHAACAGGPALLPAPAFSPAPFGPRAAATSPSGPPATVEPLPEPRSTIPFPATRSPQLEIQNEQGLVSLVVRDAAHASALRARSEPGAEYRLGREHSAPVTVTLDKVPLEDRADRDPVRLWVRLDTNNNIIHVTSLTGSSKLPADIQGRQLMVFNLDYVSALDLDLTVKGLLSPVRPVLSAPGRTPSTTEERGESLVVEDVPASGAGRGLRGPNGPAATSGDDRGPGAAGPAQGRQPARRQLQRPVPVRRHGYSLSNTGLRESRGPQAFLFNIDGGELDALWSASSRPPIPKRWPSLVSQSSMGRKAHPGRPAVGLSRDDDDRNEHPGKRKCL